jgi:ferredoxin-NADP reductase
MFELPFEPQHLPGQHYEIRLTASDGYQAARLYSAASIAGPDPQLSLTIALLPDGEVSSYMHNSAAIGDEIELRGPLGLIAKILQALDQPLCFVCGATPFVEAMADLLVDCGVPPEKIKAERFGAA